MVLEAFSLPLNQMLMMINRYWKEKGKSGFHVFKYSLKRQKGQPEVSYKFKTVGEERAEAVAQREHKRHLREEDHRHKAALQVPMPCP